MNSPSAQRMVGKVALVTGAASGIGKATAQPLAEEGARVALADLNQPELARVADAICAAGGQAIATRLHVTSETDWQAAMTRIPACAGPRGDDTALSRLQWTAGFHPVRFPASAARCQRSVVRIG